jgi:succinyl-CoA synthetase beta subunit
VDSEVARVISVARRDGRHSLFEHEAYRVLDSYGIDTPSCAVDENVDDSVASAKKSGYPIVLKIVSPDILHKTDAGGVILSVNNEAEHRISFKRLVETVQQKNPNSRIKGVLAEEMIPSGIEVIVGGLRDDQFGPSVMFGAGGVLAELLQDVSFRVAPISRFDAIDLIDDMRFPILNGFRGVPRVNKEALADLLLKTSRILIDVPEIDSLDMNPVMIHNERVTAVDARILIATHASE